MTLPAFYPPAAWRPVVNRSGAMNWPTRGLVPHVQQGNGSLYARFNDPSTQVSSHLWLSKAGAWEQYVDLRAKAWAEAAGNANWISVECEGYDTEDYTPIQVQRLAEFFAWAAPYDGWPPVVCDSPTGRGLGAHRMGGAAWGGHTCPGPIRAGRRADILAAASGQSTGGDMANTDDLRKVLDEGTASGQGSWAGTSKATLGGVQTDINVDQADLTVDQANAKALARIEALLGSLPGGSGGPLTAGQIVNALSELSRQDLGAVVAAGVQLLATTPA